MLVDILDEWIHLFNVKWAATIAINAADAASFTSCNSHWIYMAWMWMDFWYDFTYFAENRGESGKFTVIYCRVHSFFSKFLMGETQNFPSPSGRGGTCEKNPTEAKSTHLMQN